MLKASKQTIAKLKAAVKADAARAQAITLAISKTPHGPETGPGRDSLWREKRGGRPNRRYTLLAYAMARGVPYVVVEPTCRQGVDEYKLSRVLGSFVPDIDRVHWSRERIESWAAIRPAVPESEAA